MQKKSHSKSLSSTLKFDQFAFDFDTDFELTQVIRSQSKSKSNLNLVRTRRELSSFNLALPGTECSCPAKKRRYVRRRASPGDLARSTPLTKLEGELGCRSAGGRIEVGRGTRTILMERDADALARAAPQIVTSLTSKFGQSAINYK
eukprot:scaffold322295_cov24-Tisochrysis_lutea.AAC.1